jgi:hypothetical protein
MGCDISVVRLRAPPNMRLKLPGLPLKGIVRSLAAGHQVQGGVPCVSAHVARSLSAIR